MKGNFTMTNFFQKILNFFTNTKTKYEELKAKVENFIELHRGNIKVLMNVFQALYEKNDGTAKMQNVVKSVFSALGASTIGDEYADEITEFIEEKCQQIYDELVAEGGLSG